MQSVRSAGLILCLFILLPGLSLASQNHFPLLLTHISSSRDPLWKADPFWQSVVGAPHLFERKALELPPTHPSFSLTFPLTFTRRVLWDAGYLLTAPGRWDRRGWTKFSLFAVATGGVMGLDRTIDLESRRRHPRSSGEEAFEEAFEDIGSAWGVLGVIGGSSLFGFLFESDTATAIATDMAEAEILSGLLVTDSLKAIVGRSRPEVRQGPFRFNPFGGASHRSFPSGHTARAFTMAAVIAEHFQNNLWVALPVYGLATMVGVARVRANEHFASDVLVGAGIGTVVGRMVVRLEKGRQAQQGRVTVVPLLDPDGGGLSVRVQF